jgi:hypothetical protein
LVFKNNADVPNSHLLHAVENLSNKLVQSTAIRPFQNYDTGFYSIPDELKLIIFNALLSFPQSEVDRFKFDYAKELKIARADFMQNSKAIRLVSFKCYQLHKSFLTDQVNPHVSLPYFANTFQSLLEPQQLSLLPNGIAELKENLAHFVNINSHITVDFSSFNAEQLAFALPVFMSALAEKEMPMQALDITMDIDQDPRSLVFLNNTLGTLKSKPLLQGTRFEFNLCCLNTEHRTTIPDLSMLSNLTGLDVSWCEKLQTTPDVSPFPHLLRLSLKRCYELTTPPNLLNNPELTHLNLDWCEKMAVRLDLAKNIKLVYFSQIHCLLLDADTSHLPLLDSLW